MTIPNGITPKRIIALAVIGVLVAGLIYLAFAPDASVSVPEGSQAGDLILEPCTYATESGARDADCGTIIVPENRLNATSRLIALPVVRIRATENFGNPIFRLQGGPGITNMTFLEASRFTDRHDVVLVGYRGVEGSSVLDCPEVASALKRSEDLLHDETLRKFSEGFALCGERFREDGVDLDGYSLGQRVDDLEAVRQALGYDKINLIGQSVGTRTAMIYSWRYPQSIKRSVLLAVNPPGHFQWPPATTDEQIRNYADLCSRDAECSGRTDDLAESMRNIATDMPDRWLFLPIKEGNVRVVSMFGFFETTSEAAPLNAPMVLDSWLSAADGDSSGIWFLSFLGDVAFPELFVWGELAATAKHDAEVINAYFLAGGDYGSILGNAGTEFLWGGGGLVDAWPGNIVDGTYSQVQESEVETLLIGGSVDFSTPAEFATNEILPFLPNGHQVVLAEFAHVMDFWTYQREASDRLLSTFFDTGEVDDSLYTYRQMDFGNSITHRTLAFGILGTAVGFAVIAILSLWWARHRAHSRVNVGTKGRMWNWLVVPLIAVYPLISGLGGWFLVTFIVMAIWPAVSLDNEFISVVSMGLPIGLGIYWVWVHRNWSASLKKLGLGLAIGGSLVGAWAGFNSIAGLFSVITTIVGAALAANLALIALDISWDRAARVRTSSVA